MLKYRIPQIVTLTLNIFVNLIGQKESEKVSLSIDKESFFEIYEIN